MERVHYPRNKRPPGRLVSVIIISLGILITGCSGITTGINQENTRSLNDYRIKSAEEVLSSRPGYIYQQPLIYLLFLPGPLVLITVQIIKRQRRPRSLPLAIMLLALSPLLGQINPENRLDAGSIAYYSGKFDEALQHYLDTSLSLPENSVLQYNIALCYYKLDKPGYAIHALKKAIKIDCANPAINGLLSQLEKKYQLNAQVNTNPYFHPDIPFIIFLVFFNLTFILLTLILNIKKGHLVILFICAAVITCLGLGIFIAGEIHTRQAIGVITGGLAPIKQIPDELGKERINVKEGTIVKVLWEIENNVFIQTGRGFKGWVKKENIIKNW